MATSRKSQTSQNEPGWQEYWDARAAALEKLFGPSEDGILTSFHPIYLGGQTDVMVFLKHVRGYTYITAGLTATSSQKPSKLGQYELMLCCRKDDQHAASLLSNLSNYTLENAINPFDTIDLGEKQPPKVTLRALLALEPDPPRNRFEMYGKTHGILLLVGITTPELKAYRSSKKDAVLAALKASVLPYTDPYRQSVC